MIMRVTVGTKIWGSLCMVLLVLLVVGGVSLRVTDRLTADAAWRSHTYQVQGAITELLSIMQDVETGQRGFLITGDPKFLEPYESALGRLQPGIRSLRNLITDNPDQMRNMDRAEEFIAVKAESMRMNVDIRRNQGFQESQAAVMTLRGQKAMDDFRGVIAQMHAVEDTLLRQREAELKETTEMARASVIGGALIAGLLVLASGLYLSRNIATPLQEITRIAERIGSGDLTVTLTPSTRADEVGTLSDTFMRMTRSLRQLMQELAEGINVLGAAGSQIVSTTAQVAASAAETATALAETSSTMEEVRKTSQLSTEKARHVADTAQATAQISATGKRAVEQSIAGINLVRDQIGAIAEAVIKLSEQSQAIGTIVASVNDLAEQSNLLAVNAAIEAARAGEQGKGFVVVATEVKSLAEQSKEATAQVRAILTDIQKATATAVLAAEQGSKAVDAGVRQSLEAGQAIENLAQNIAIATQASTQIVASNQQQQVGIDQVALAMDSIRQASTQNTVATKQAETAAHNLNALGHKLKSLVSQYRA
ncbi:HAMP domain-containing protein [Niveispirillum sp. SYP-B3756]|nr:HAMP domain-containing protein [Niveispirillum sp. SYP-B3756]